MKAFSASEAKTRILVWHAPVPVFHWLLALSFAGGLCDRRKWSLAGGAGLLVVAMANPSTLASGEQGPDVTRRKTPSAHAGRWL